METRPKQLFAEGRVTETSKKEGGGVKNMVDEQKSTSRCERASVCLFTGRARDKSL